MDIQVNFLEIPVIGKRVSFTRNGRSMEISSNVISIDVSNADPAFFRVCTQSGTVYIGKVRAAINNQTVIAPTQASIITTAGHRRFRYVAIILALLLGTFGVHKFYLGKNRWNILYPISSAIGSIFAALTVVPFLGLMFLPGVIIFIGLPALIAFIECLIYAWMSDDMFNIRYN